MLIDLRVNISALKNKQVVDLSSGNEIPDIAYADDDVGIYRVWKRKNDYSNAIETDPNGDPVTIEHTPGRGTIRIVRR